VFKEAAGSRLPPRARYVIQVGVNLIQDTQVEDGDLIQVTNAEIALKLHVDDVAGSIGPTIWDMGYRYGYIPYPYGHPRY
jgi:hypothetical protein